MLRLKTTDVDFKKRFDALVSARRDQPTDVREAVANIIADVKARGDKAVYDYTQKFDRIDLHRGGSKLDKKDLSSAFDAIDDDLKRSLTLAKDRIEAHHKRQLPENTSYVDNIGAELGTRWTPLDSVGLYVPGGRASYPSSLLMNAIPAKVAGVRRIAMVVPTPDGQSNPAVLAAAYLAGVDEVYCIGGAQAVAALAYGTETIQPVVKIVGPGNAYVAEAKRQVFGVVGIDMIAGPSEVVVVADASANPNWVAADLLAQAEHDEAAQAILITDCEKMAEAAERAVQDQLTSMPRRTIAEKSWDNHGAIITVSHLIEAVECVNLLAPEHLELSCQNAETLLPSIHNAGAVFIGAFTPEAVGDYVAGSNHVLPTSRAARFSSGLGVLDFMKRTSTLKLSEASLSILGPATCTLAQAEGLDGHRHSVAIRLRTRQ